MLALLGCILIGRADEVHEVYMLRLDDEIGSTTWRHTREALVEAEREGRGCCWCISTPMAARWCMPTPYAPLL